MSCFCQTSLAPLTLALPSLDVAAMASMNASAQAALSLDAWLSARAAIGRLNPAWLSLPLPSLNISANALVTISLLAQLRSQVSVQLGLDLLAPGQLTAFTRMMATLNARLAVMPGMALNMGGWLQLASFNAALLRLQAAVQAGAFAGLNLAANPSLSLAAEWGPFIGGLTPLAMLLTAMAQLNVSAASAAQLATMVNAMAAIRLPALPAASIMQMCQLSAGLSAVAQLGLSLGVSPLQLGFPAVRAMVAANFSATLAALASVGVRLSANLSAALTAGLPGLPGGLPSIPSFTTSAVVRAAVALDTSAFASLNLALSASPMLMVGLSGSALAANLSAALAITASARPCGVCDSRSVMASLSLGAST